MTRLSRWAQFFCIGAMLMVTACTTTPKLQEGEAAIPLILEDYFIGTTKGSGVFVNSINGSERQFDVVIEGSWDGKVLTLVEDFFYADGEEDRKTWRLTKTGPTTYSGTREDVIGEAVGTQEGPIVRLKYKIRLGDTTVRFSDVLGLIDENTLVNRAIVTKWGFPVGRVDLTLTRVEDVE